MFGQIRSPRMLRAALLGAAGYLALSVTPFLAVGPTQCNAAGGSCVFAPGRLCLDGGRFIENYRPRPIIVD